MGLCKEQIADVRNVCKVQEKSDMCHFRIREIADIVVGVDKIRIE